MTTGREANPSQILETWLNANEERLSGRFEVGRVNDWSLWQEQGIALDLVGRQVSGRITVWAEHDMPAGSAVADCEALCMETEKTLFSWSHVQFTPDLIDKWFSFLESGSGADAETVRSNEESE